MIGSQRRVWYLEHYWSLKVCKSWKELESFELYGKEAKKIMLVDTGGRL